MTTPILSVKNLNAWYDKIQVLHDVSLDVFPGEIVSIIGPNGAGKSTVLKSVFGLVGRRTGSIAFRGRDITRLAPDELVLENLAYVPQGRSVFPSLTVEENLQLGGFIREDDLKDDLAYVYMQFPRLKERRRQKAGLLSGGEQQMLALGRSLMLNPDLILLDEPSLGLSPQTKKQIFDKIAEINAGGIAVLAVEQNAKLSLSLSHRAYVLELGRNRLEGTGLGLLHDPRVQRLYLGGA